MLQSELCLALSIRKDTFSSRKIKHNVKILSWHAVPCSVSCLRAGQKRAYQTSDGAGHFETEFLMSRAA